MSTARRLAAATVERMRKAHTDNIVAAAGIAEEAGRVAQDRRKEEYESWYHAHGPLREGKLSYQEIADAAQASRGWVIGVVKRMRAAAQGTK